MYKKVAFLLVIIVAAVMLFATTKPDTFIVRRAVTIAAPPEKILPFINDFHQWAAWAPREQRDPALRRGFSGAPRGDGAVYDWSGNDKVGAGRMTITAATPTLVTIRLDMLQPYVSHNITTFTLEPQGAATRVTWDMSGPSPYAAKVISVFASMDTVAGKDFEAGLARLKSLAEQ